VSLDGSTGALYVGQLPTVEARFEDQPELQTILGWADEIRRMAVWTNADKPEEAAQARSYGAQGIGLCRTEHMFREGERLEIVRGAILVANRRRGRRPSGPRRAARAPTSGDDRDLRRRDGQARGAPAGRLRGHLPGDGRPARRHPPDRPAAPRVPAEPRGAAGQGHPGRGAGGASEEDKELLATIKSLHEQNPMLGLRGCRLGLMIPDFVKIQTRAILNAQIAVKRAAATRSPRS
jgi:pyruvate,orthophosphate dikinase